MGKQIGRQAVLPENHQRVRQRLVESFRSKELPTAFRQWMLNPTEDWELFMKVIPNV